MEFTKESNRIYSVNEEGAVVAEITFPENEDGACVIDHTFVDESIRGQGVAGKLVAMAVEQIKEQGKKVQATCSYAASWLEKQVEIEPLSEEQKIITVHTR